MPFYSGCRFFSLELKEDTNARIRLCILYTALFLYHLTAGLSTVSVVLSVDNAIHLINHRSVDWLHVVHFVNINISVPRDSDLSNE